MIIGGGIAGLSTAYAAIANFPTMRVHVIENGTICGQGATAAAKQGHVYMPDGGQNASSDMLENFRSESLDIYKELDTWYGGVDLRQTGSARSFLGESWWDRLVSKLEWWTYAQALKRGHYDTTFVDAATLAKAQDLHGETVMGALWDAHSAAVVPCKVLAVMKAYVEASEYGTVHEQTQLVSVTTETLPLTADREYKIAIARASSWKPEVGKPAVGKDLLLEAKSVVVATGYWHNSVMKRFFPACTEDRGPNKGSSKGPNVVGVATQTAIYDLPWDLPPVPNTVLSFSPGAGLQELRPAFLESDVAPCGKFAPRGTFFTGCKNESWARYLYSTSWTDPLAKGGFGQGRSTFATGTRQEPQENIDDCICQPENYYNRTSGEGDCLPWAAPGVPYDKDLEDWTFNRSTMLYNILEKRDAVLVESYTACFPTAMDGNIYAKLLLCPNNVYPRLFVLNGLGDRGITRGPGAGLHVAKLVAQSLNVISDGPPVLPQRHPAWMLNALFAEYAEYFAVYFTGLVLLSAFFCCIHWQGPRKGHLRGALECRRGEWPRAGREAGVREAGVRCFFFVFLATCLVPLGVLSAIAEEALALLAMYVGFYLALLCTVVFCWRWCGRLEENARRKARTRRAKTGALIAMTGVTPHPD